jgi:hypothetical protein
VRALRLYGLTVKSSENSAPKATKVAQGLVQNPHDNGSIDPRVIVHQDVPEPRDADHRLAQVLLPRPEIRTPDPLLGQVSELPEQ